MVRDGLSVLSTVFDIARPKNRRSNGDVRFPHRPSSRLHIQEETTDDNVIDSSDGFRLPKTRSLVTMLVASMLMQVRRDLHNILSQL